MVETEFGNAHLSNGYLRLPDGELLHRKIYEKYVGKIPENYQIHHLNEDKLDNRVENLICLSRSEHRTLHMTKNNPMRGKVHTKEAKDRISKANKGRIVSDEAKAKISAANKGRPMHENTRNALYLRMKGCTFDDKWKHNLSNSTNSFGIYRLSKHKGKVYKQGFTWRYTVYEDGKYHDLCSVNLLKLKKRVISKGWDWIILDEVKAQVTAESVGLTLEDLL